MIKIISPLKSWQISSRHRLETRQTVIAAIMNGKESVKEEQRIYKFYLGGLKENFLGGLSSEQTHI